jgi:membrane protease YdiL (CAAX protease family)
MAAALILTFSSKGKEGVLGLLRRSFSGRFNKIWWLVAILLWPALQGVSMLMAVYLGGDTAPEIPLFSEPLSLLPGLLFTFFLGGALGEEMGWRGYALPRVQNNFNALISSLIVGVIWAFWHLPLYITPEASGRGMPFFLFFIVALLQSPIYTWLYNNTNRSLWPVMIFHAFQNYAIFNVLNTESGGMYFLLVFFLAVILIVVIWKPKNLVREKRPQPEPH